MELSWSGRRQLMYYGVSSIILVVILFLVWNTFFNIASTCFDGIQNGDEHGIDCGGSCALICSNEAHAPIVLWSRSFETTPHVYTAAAYVQNNNVGAASHQVAYSFQLFDDQNSLITERDGVVDIPPVQTMPVIETGIPVGNRTVARTLFAFSRIPNWSRVPAHSIPLLTVTGQALSPDASTLRATIVNNDLKAASGVVVEAVLFDEQGVARAASKSLIGTIAGHSSAPVVFTWGSSVVNIVRAEITILPSF